MGGGADAEACTVRAESSISAVPMSRGAKMPHGRISDSESVFAAEGALGGLLPVRGGRVILILSYGIF